MIQVILPVQVLGTTIIQGDSTSANRLEIAVVEFADNVQTLVDPSLAQNFTMPTLTTKGLTALVDGVREGITIARSRKAWYKQTGQPYYRPWVILITDGEPTSNQDINGLTQEIAEGVAKKDFYFFALGVEGANMQMQGFLIKRARDLHIPTFVVTRLQNHDYYPLPS